MRFHLLFLRDIRGNVEDRDRFAGRVPDQGPASINGDWRAGLGGSNEFAGPFAFGKEHCKPTPVCEGCPLCELLPEGGPISREAD